MRQNIYSRLPNVTVQELHLDETDLDTRRMLDLMAISSIQGGGMPLYLHVVTRILRQLRIAQQASDSTFNYRAFKQALDNEDLTPGQRVPLQQRLETLESFMAAEQVPVAQAGGSKKKNKGKENTALVSKKRVSDWNLKVCMILALRPHKSNATC